MLLVASAVVLLLVVLNGLFAMSELAIVSARKSRLQTLADRGDRGAASALKLADEPTRFLSSVQVGITLIGILAGAYGQATIAAELDALLETVPGFAPYSEAVSTGLVVVVITYLSLIVGELVPKRIALIMPEGIAAVVARPLSLLAVVMGPFVTLLTASTTGVLRLLRVKDEAGQQITKEEVETVLAEGAGAGVIEPEERVMMHEVMRLGDRPVRVAMTPRTDVYWVSLDSPEDELREAIRRCPYSRIVVLAGHDFDSAIGVAHKRDIADALLAGGPLQLKALLHEPLFLPETTSLLRALEQLQSSSTHLAIVVDEFGGFEGVITPIDILEMIAGDFPEEHDSPEQLIVEREDGSWLVDARIDLVELGDRLEEPFEGGSGYHTLAGLILDRLGRFPVEGEHVQLGAFDAEVVDMDERRIDKLILRRTITGANGAGAQAPAG